MADKTAFDILFDNLSARGLHPEKQISERNFIVPGVDRMSNTKYIFARNKTFYFCAYDSYGTSAYSSKTFTGIFSSINLPPETDCHIYNKNWVDLILRRHKRKSGVKFIDELKDKTIIGIETDLWLYEENDLDFLMNLGGQLIENMTNACA